MPDPLNKHANVDPDNIGNIYRLSLYPFVHGLKKTLMEYKKALSNIIKNGPSIILCNNYIAPICSKILYPNIKNLYLISGLCNAIEICEEFTASDIVTKNIYIPQSIKEINAINNSDVIVINSALTMQIFHNSYPEYLHKVYPTIIDTSGYASLLIKQEFGEDKFNEKNQSNKLAATCH